MARGKEAARTANKRAEAAQERIGELEQVIARLKSDHAVALREIREERDQARSKLVREVDRMSADLVADAEMNSRVEVRTIKDQADQRTRNAIRFLGHFLPSDVLHATPNEKWEEMAAATGVPAAVILEDLGFRVKSNRAGRRWGIHGGGCQCGRCATEYTLVSAGPDA